jgi:hypothetical protein
MRPARHTYLVEKAMQAAVAAIEVYNKPGFKYREETFAILMLNAWELLLKARVLKENNNKLRSIEVWESKLTKGSRSSKLTPKKNRAGNTITVGLFSAVQAVRAYPKQINRRICHRKHFVVGGNQGQRDTLSQRWPGSSKEGPRDRGRGAS